MRGAKLFQYSVQQQIFSHECVENGRFCHNKILTNLMD